MAKGWTDGDIPKESPDVIDESDSNVPRIWAKTTKAWAEKDWTSFEELSSSHKTFRRPLRREEPAMTSAPISEATEEPGEPQYLNVQQNTSSLGELKPSRIERDSISILSDQERLIGRSMFETELKTPQSFFQRREAQAESSRLDMHIVDQQSKGSGARNLSSEGEPVAREKSEVKLAATKALSQDADQLKTAVPLNAEKARTALPVQDLDTLIQDVERLVQELRRMKEEKLASEAELVVDQARSFISERNLTDAPYVL
eukprot:scaffold9695_cov181-Amphora_coffeaeformis.AAC.1